MREVESWQKDPVAFLRQRGREHTTASAEEEEVYVLIVEGFLIFNHRYIKKAFLKILCL